MRKIIATAFISLDGVMQGPGGPTEDPSDGFDLGGWTAKYASEKSSAAVMQMVGTLAKPHDLLLGRKTYDIFVRYWPQAPADSPIGSVFAKANKYVMTTGTQPLTWPTSHQLRSIDDLTKLKAGSGPDMVLWGSSTLYPQLLETNLIDRMQLLIFPLTLGKGKKVFGSGTPPVSMKLASSEVTPTGVIIATYEATP